MAVFGPKIGDFGANFRVFLGISEGLFLGIPGAKIG